MRLFPRICPSAQASLQRGCTFAHRAVLLFPTDLDDAIDDLGDLGFNVDVPVPSVLVRRRLCQRYGLSHDACDVSVTRVRTLATSVEVELFLFPKKAPALTQAIIEAERVFGFEDHLALEVHTPNERTLDRLVRILQRDGGLVFEGGGHNPKEGVAGSTMLYFVGQTTALTTKPRFERFELYCRGDYSAVVERYPVDYAAVAAVYSAWHGAGQRRHPMQGADLRSRRT